MAEAGERLHIIGAGGSFKHHVRQTRGRCGAGCAKLREAA